MAENKDRKSAAPKAKKTGFWHGVKAEWKKIIWPSREDLIKETGLVVLISVIMGLLITGVDSMALKVINWILSI